MTEIYCKTDCQDHQAGESAVKCLFQGQNRMACMGFEPKPSRSQSGPSNHSTTLPINVQKKEGLNLKPTDL